MSEMDGNDDFHIDDVSTHRKKHTLRMEGKYHDIKYSARDDKDEECGVNLITVSKTEIKEANDQHPQDKGQIQNSGLSATEVNGIPKIEHVSKPIIESFKNKYNERSCFGHKETIFGLSLSPCGQFCASASQDATIKVWNVENNKLMSTLFGHSSKYECLRVAWGFTSWFRGEVSRVLETDKKSSENEFILASAGADGVVIVWQSIDGCHNWFTLVTLDHKIKKLNKKESENYDFPGKETEDQEDDVPQIYTLQFIDKWKASFTYIDPDDANIGEYRNCTLNLLMTSSDDFLHFWEQGPLDCNFDQTNSSSSGKKGTTRAKLTLQKIMSIRFTHLDAGFGGVFVHLHLNKTEQGITHDYPSEPSDIMRPRSVYGGDRNADNLVYVFDASHCPANNLLGVALSDGTLRLVSGRGVCVSLLQLPGCQSHLTSFCWDSTGTRLACCVATGQLILWAIDFGDGKGTVYPSCQAILGGGHDLGRPLYGAKYFGGEDEELVVSWGVDGKLCLWDSRSIGQVSPLSILISKPDYPLYAVDTTSQTNKGGESIESCPISRIAMGGGREGSFLGIPVYIQDIFSLQAQ